jgi:hypothetical protein
MRGKSVSHRPQWLPLISEGTIRRRGMKRMSLLRRARRKKRRRPGWTDRCADAFEEIRS